MGPKNFAFAIIVAVAISAGVFVATKFNTPAALQSALVIPATSPLPDFELVDHEGGGVTAETFRGHWDLLFFGFTHCPDICPATLQILAAAKDQLENSGRHPLPRIVLVSVDPERDTPAAMAKYVNYFGDDNLGVTGSLEELVKLTSELGIFFEKQASDGDNYSVDHSAAVLLINPDGNFHALFGAPHTIADYVHDLPIIMAGK